MQFGFGPAPWEGIVRMHREYLRKTIEDCQRRGDRYYGYRGGWPTGDIESEQFKRMCRAFDVDPDGWWPVVT